MEEQRCAGATTYSPELKVSFRYRLTSEVTVFTAEAWAIFQSLILIQDTDYSKVVIFSDSKSVLESIGSNRLINSNYIIHWIKRLLALLIGASTSLLPGSQLIVAFRATK